MPPGSRRGRGGSRSRRRRKVLNSSRSGTISPSTLSARSESARASPATNAPSAMLTPSALAAKADAADDLVGADRAGRLDRPGPRHRGARRGPLGTRQPRGRGHRRPGHSRCHCHRVRRAADRGRVTAPPAAAGADRRPAVAGALRHRRRGRGDRHRLRGQCPWSQRSARSGPSSPAWPSPTPTSRTVCSGRSSLSASCSARSSSCRSGSCSTPARSWRPGPWCSHCC